MPFESSLIAHHTCDVLSDHPSDTEWEKVTYPSISGIYYYSKNLNNINKPDEKKNFYDNEKVEDKKLIIEMIDSLDQLGWDRVACTIRGPLCNAHKCIMGNGKQGHDVAHHAAAYIKTKLQEQLAKETTQFSHN